MFQYAYGRALSIRTGLLFKMDLRWFKAPHCHREYGLNRFAILESVATEEEIASLLALDKPRRFVRENLSIVDRSLLEVKDNTYVEGDFGHERFFASAAETIRREFTLKSVLAGQNAIIAQEMGQNESVCLSVRRGDFVGHLLHDVCGMSYFQRAINVVCNQVRDPLFFVCSDDKSWVQQNLKVPAPHRFVSHNYPNFYEDLRLMTYCKHYIVPNSTFSWWGAWLTRNPGGTTIAPARWVNYDAVKDPKFVEQYADWLRDWCPGHVLDRSVCTPQHWILIEN
jgi:hypothetical protein